MAYQRILVPVDYSDCSRAAVNTALEIAQKFSASIDIVHVWDRPTYVSDVLMVGSQGQSQKSLVDLIRENAEKDMNDFLATLQFPSGVAVSHRLISGEPASTIIEELGKGGHDLVIVSTHGRTGLAHLLLGSVTEKLVRLSPVPVLTVPAPK
ncbi:MAG TPA: universal stress protein [Polyangiaceae bacterium]|nr:universal stress protein [Polyangiaceae bacterium]